MTRVFKTRASAVKVAKAFYNWAGDPTQLFDIIEELEQSGFYVAGERWTAEQIREAMKGE